MLQTQPEHYYYILGSIQGTIIKEADDFAEKNLVVVIGWQSMQRVH
jgi:hypothetical protein